MGRDFYISSETIVSVVLIGAEAGSFGGQSVELGLTSEPVVIAPRFYHKDIHVDDFGDKVPADIMCQLLDVVITMTLVHFDPKVLDACIFQSIGNNQADQGSENLVAAGTMMGNGLGLSEHGNSYIQLEITPTTSQSWTFPAAYLMETPVQWPIGYERSLVRCTWRAIPYVPLPNTGEITSGGATIWINSPAGESDEGNP